MVMEDLRKQILDETIRFRERLPELLPEYSGRWVVFRDGEVQSVHDSEDDAYRAGLQRFGREGGYIVVRVAEEKPTPVSAGSVFGLG